ncbi:MAG: GIY-YIG nuclease family protein [Novosphingobium sp.]|nr:GIY-YIG nuclease family protein [Novosphingobium sp.]
MELPELTEKVRSMADIQLLRPIEAIAELLRPAPVVHVGTTEAAPVCAGAYVLLVELVEPLCCVIGGKAARFEVGCYIYSGSAYGPGGIRSRLGRHFRRDKKPHWHIDTLSSAASGIQAIAVEGGSECGIIARLLGSPAFHSALTGFGSSDCSVCASHLLNWHEPQLDSGLCGTGRTGMVGGAEKGKALHA